MRRRLRIHLVLSGREETATVSKMRDGKGMASLPIEFNPAVIEKAVAEADRGVFVSRDAVDRWVESWGSGAEKPAPRSDVSVHEVKIATDAAGDD